MDDDVATIKNISLALKDELDVSSIVVIAQSATHGHLPKTKTTQIVRKVVQSSQQVLLSAYDTSLLVESFSQFIQTGWKTDKLLGEGTYGDVYQMSRLSDERKKVAKKIFKKGLVTDTIREIGTYALLTASHAKNTVDVKGLSFKKTISIVLEKASTDLHQLGKDWDEQIKIQQFGKILDLTLASLGEIHACNLVNCDVKPSNILIFLDANGSIEKAVIADFGLTSSLPYETDISTVYTEPWRPLEIVKNGPSAATKESDIWALGVSMIDFLAGGYLFYDTDQPDDIDEKDWLLQIRSRPIPDNTLELLGYTKRRDQILSMIKADPNDRYIITEPVLIFPSRNWENNVVSVEKIKKYFTEWFADEGKVLIDILVQPLDIKILAVDIFCRFLHTYGGIWKNKNFEPIVSMCFVIASKWGSDEVLAVEEIKDYLNSVHDVSFTSIVALKQFEMDIISGLNGLVYIPGLEAMIKSIDKTNPDQWFASHFSLDYNKMY